MVSVMVVQSVATDSIRRLSLPLGFDALWDSSFSGLFVQHGESDWSDR